MTQNSLVIDASVVLEWIETPESKNFTKAISVYENLKEGKIVVYAPLFLLMEVINVLFWKKKFERLEIEEFVNRVKETGVNFIGDFLPESANEVIDLMDKFKISAYDAQYVNLAIKKGVKLMTFDAKLQKIKETGFEF